MPLYKHREFQLFIPVLLSVIVRFRYNACAAADGDLDAAGKGWMNSCKTAKLKAVLHPYSHHPSFLLAAQFTTRLSVSPCTITENSTMK